MPVLIEGNLADRVSPDLRGYLASDEARPGKNRKLSIEIGMETLFTPHLVEMWPVNRLVPYALNARQHSDKQIDENAAWDEEMLNIELQALRAEQFDLALTGFSDAELEHLLARVDSETLGEEDAAPAAEPGAVSRSGDLWILGDHRVICGDALSRSNYERLLEGECADMVFTDPPYNVDYQSRLGPIANDNLGDGFGEFLSQASTNMQKKLAKAVAQ